MAKEIKEQGKRERERLELNVMESRINKMSDVKKTINIIKGCARHFNQS